MSRAEKRWALCYAVAVMAITTLPYLIGFARQGDEWAFSGFVFGVDDGNSYIAKMAQGARGAWLFTFPYTSEPQRGAFVYPFFLLLGKLAAPDAGLHEQLVAIFHIARFVAGVGLLLAIYHFAAGFLPDVTARRAALILASLGGGVGWLLTMAGKSDWLGGLPLEFYSPEAFTFLDLYGLPHLSAARALLLAGLLVYLRRLIHAAPNRPAVVTLSGAKSLGAITETLRSEDASLRSARQTDGGLRRTVPDRYDSTRPAAQEDGPVESTGLRWLGSVHPGLLLLLAGLIQPVTLAVAFPVLAVHVVLTATAGARSQDWATVRRTALAAGVTVLIASPIAAYTAAGFVLDPLLNQWAAQNTIVSPHPLHYLLAYGLLIVPAALGLRWLSRRPGQSAGVRLLLGWTLALPLLLYSPLNIQRRLSEAFFVPLATLAVAGIWHALPARAAAWRRVVVVAVFGLTLPAAFILLAGGMGVANRPAAPAFLPRAMVRAFEYLNREAEPGAVVLSIFEVGNALPAYAPLVAYLGHGPETLYFAQKSAAVREFFGESLTDDERRALLTQGRVNYVFYGPDEAALGEFDPSSAPFLRRIYNDEGYSVFVVVK